jgi:acetyltransferase-like isoleucine patch superfamily enzyme
MNGLTAFDHARHASWLRGCERVGHMTRLYGRPTLLVSGGHIRIGDRFRLASQPVASHLAAGGGGVLEIGDDVWIGHGAAIAAFERVQIGHGTRIGPFVIIMDTNFHRMGGDQAVQHDCRPVMIGEGCRIGSRVTITRGATIGDGAEILAGSVVSSAIPPGACAGGARARVLGRAGDRPAFWNGSVDDQQDR